MQPGDRQLLVKTQTKARNINKGGDTNTGGKLLVKRPIMAGSGKRREDCRATIQTPFLFVLLATQIMPGCIYYGIEQAISR